MTVYDYLKLLGGLALFLYGMTEMGDGLKEASGSKLEDILKNLTSSRWRAFLLGLGVTGVIQSSAATTVMVVGLVNSGIMQLSRAVGVILGANVGTTVTAWLISLTGINSSNPVIAMFKPENFSPILGIVGVSMLMFSKKEKQRSIGKVLIGFAVLMIGITTMSGAVSPLTGDEDFEKMLISFSNPFLGFLIGLVMTLIVQSSSASVGILQTLSLSGTLTVGTAIPIIMGDNVGTAITAMLSSIGTSRDARRSALVHLYYCIIKSGVFMIIFYALNSAVHFTFLGVIADPILIAIIHSVFNLIAALIMLPVSDILLKLVYRTVPVTEDERKDAEIEKKQKLQILDERFLWTPGFALEQSFQAACTMADDVQEALFTAIPLIENFDETGANRVTELEKLADTYEDQLGSYLVKLSRSTLSKSDSHMLSSILHCIVDFERISDHALNIMQSAQEINKRGESFSPQAKAELAVFTAALEEITRMAVRVFKDSDLELATMVEPLEQVIDGLNVEMKQRHIRRLQQGICDITTGFVLSDISTNYERVADHCSNVAVCLLEANQDAFDTHAYLERIRSKDNPEFRKRVASFEAKYSLPPLPDEN